MRNYIRYAVGVLFLIGIILLIILGFNIIRGIFSTDEVPEQGQVQPEVNLSEAAAANHAVQYTIIGSTVAREEHHSIRITVDNDSRRIDVLEGYEGQTIKSRELGNTTQAYEAFLAALNGAGYTNKLDPEGRGEEARSCPLGLRYSYEVNPGGQQQFRTWSVSCTRDLGTFAGNAELVRTLFKAQIPDYQKFVAGIRVNY